MGTISYYFKEIKNARLDFLKVCSDMFKGKKEKCVRKTAIITSAAIIFMAALTFVWGGSQSLGGITLLEVTPRIITPNGDNFNDKAFFKFDTSLTGIPFTAAIYDISGAKISGLMLDDTEKSLTWDGKDQSGKAVPSGIYIYQINVGQKTASGTVVVAR